MRYDPTSEKPLKMVRFKHRVFFTPKGKSQSADHIESADHKDVELFKALGRDGEVFIRHEDESQGDVVVPVENVACYVVGYTDRFPEELPDEEPLKPVAIADSDGQLDAAPSKPEAERVDGVDFLAVDRGATERQLTKAERKAQAKLARASK